ncbi:MAG: hypothetical protein A2X80_14110 [Geobacteraceae bacterium GWB2_52_12]|nr:MAG: hypothetical protein A2X80_14110 [Geobacteraceae bacterium GWB2_52_12]
MLKQLTPTLVISAFFYLALIVPAHAGIFDALIEKTFKGAAEQVAGGDKRGIAPSQAAQTARQEVKPKTVSAARISDAERTFVAPRATELVTEKPRKTFLRGAFGQKFSDKQDGEGRQVTITNPYMNPPKFLFANPDAIQCKADGSLIVASRAALDDEARATAIGYWSVAPDGAVTPLHTRSTKAHGKTSITVCDAPYEQAIRLRTSNFAIDADGGLLTAEQHGVMKIGTDGYVQRLAGSPLICEGMGSRGIRGFADGPADDARFNNDGHGGGNPAVAVDGKGNIWTVDQNGCSLRHITADGSVTTLLRPEQVCSPQPPDRITLSHLAWDAKHGELVSGGDILTHNQLYTSVWRIRPDGKARRVLLAHKLGNKSPAGVQLDGVSALAVDAQGRIHIASKIMPTDHKSHAKGSNEIGVMLVDEAHAKVVPVTGMKLPAWGHGKSLALDGPVERATFVKMRGMCFAADGTLFVLDEMIVRRIDRRGQVSTWAF